MSNIMTTTCTFIIKNQFRILDLPNVFCYEIKLIFKARFFFLKSILKKLALLVRSNKMKRVLILKQFFFLLFSLNSKWNRQISASSRPQRNLATQPHLLVTWPTSTHPRVQVQKTYADQPRLMRALVLGRWKASEAVSWYVTEVESCYLVLVCYCDSEGPGTTCGNVIKYGLYLSNHPGAQSSQKSLLTCALMAGLK